MIIINDDYVVFFFYIVYLVEICLRWNVLSHGCVMTRPGLIFDNDILGVNDNDVDDSSDDKGHVDAGGNGSDDDSGDVVVDDEYVMTTNIIFIKFNLYKNPYHTLSSPIFFKNYSSEIN